MMFSKINFLIIIFLLLCSETIYAKNIGILYAKDDSTNDSLIENFIRLTEENKDSCIKFALDDTQNIKEVLENIKNSNVDTILAIGDYVVKLAIESDLPGVFINVMNPVKAGLIEKDGTLKTKLSGISMDIPMSFKLPLIKRVLPDFKKMLIIYTEDNSKYIADEYQKFLNAENISFEVVPIKEEKELLTVLADNKKGMDCIIVVVDNSIYSKTTSALTVKFSIYNRIPLIAFSSELVNSGALLGFYSNHKDLAQQSLMLINSDNKPSNISLPSGFSYSVNVQIKSLFNAIIENDIIQNAEKVIRL